MPITKPTRRWSRSRPDGRWTKPRSSRLRPRVRAAVVRGQRHQALVDLGLQGREQSSNCREAANDPVRRRVPGDTLVKGCYAGGTAQFYLNLAGRDPAATTRSGTGTDCPCNNPRQIPAANYNAVRQQIVDYFNEPDRSGQPRQAGRRASLPQGRAQRRRRDQCAAIRTAAATSSSSSVRRTRRDASTPGQLIAFSQFFGQHGYLPELVDLDALRQHARHVRGRRPGHPPHADRCAESAPWISPRPSRICSASTGRRTRAGGTSTRSRRSPAFKTIQILDISDYHGQLVPLTDTSRQLRSAGRQPGLHDRRLRLPQAVVRPVPGARASRGPSRSPRVTRSGRPHRSAPLRRHADDGAS